MKVKSILSPVIAGLIAVVALQSSAMAPTLATSDQVRETVLHAFDLNTDGAFPTSPLMRGNDGNYYGTTRLGSMEDTEFGPIPGAGSIFRMSLQGVVTTLYTFSSYDLNDIDGANPSFGSLVEDRAGNLYGTTMYGGTHGMGVVYRLSHDGQYTVLHSFDGSDGVTPYGGLVLGNDGNLYGTSTGATTTQVPLANLGSVFKITPRGKLTLVHAFTGHGDSAVPVSLMLAADGNLYGTTASQANLGLPATDRGSVFRIDPDGQFTTLHLFTGGSDGSLPVALTEVDGLFYGTTAGYDGQAAVQYGTVFTMTPDGTVTTLYTFSGGIDGANPNAGLAQAPDGNFYGTTIAGGGAGLGSVFRISPSGSFRPIYSFAGGRDGASPVSTVTPGRRAGSLYGVTEGGGTSNDGTIFRINPANTP